MKTSFSKRRCEAERGKRIQNLFVGNIDARITVYKFLIERDVDFVVVADIDVVMEGLHTRVDLGEQLHEVLDGDVGHFRVKGLLITHGVASVRKPMRVEDLRTLTASKFADSSSRLSVLSSISELRPPMMPAMATGSSLEQNHQRAFVDAALCAVQRFELERRTEKRCT